MTRQHGATRLGLHARASLRTELEEAADDLLAVTGQALDYYADLFDTPYPFGEYHQAFVPDFNAGAMENPGCVTLRDTFLYRGRSTWVDRGQRAGVVAHELAHMWFGDLVTMRWWDDLWLNESFAEYLAHRCRAAATEYPMRTEFGALRKDWGAIADQGPTTHPVAGNDAADAETALQQFDGISYAKGAAVLKQLAVSLGEDVFLAGLRTYMRRYAWANATFSDLLSCWVDAGAVDPSQAQEGPRAVGAGVAADRRDGHARRGARPVDRLDGWRSRSSAGPDPAGRTAGMRSRWWRSRRTGRSPRWPTSPWPRTRCR